MNSPDIIILDEADNVAVAAVPMSAGASLTINNTVVTIVDDIPAAHKFALRPIAAHEPVIKYGRLIGRATQPIAAGTWVHSHNLHSGLDTAKEYVYQPEQDALGAACPDRLNFQGYLRPDGRAGIRNNILIIPTVGCVNNAAQTAARRAAESWQGTGIDEFIALPHPYGCSQLGDDLEHTARILAALATHPNTGGCVLLGLGCENNNLDHMRRFLPDPLPAHIRLLNAQQSPDEIEAAATLALACAANAASERKTMPISRLVVGLKCGGSDAFSGITANPLVGAVSDILNACGAATVLTEIPEMFGAEELLMQRCADRTVFDSYTALINQWKDYYTAHGHPVYENPSPGNREGGITTLEEKSLGCIRKGGSSTVNGIAGYGQPVHSPGLSIISAPGNDIVAVTALAAAGCQLILFTTGRGTPLGAPVPVIKIASQSELARRKPGWIDCDAGSFNGPSSPIVHELLHLIIATASGTRTAAERAASHDLAIFKQGVTL